MRAAGSGLGRREGRALRGCAGPLRRDAVSLAPVERERRLGCGRRLGRSSADPEHLGEVHERVPVQIEEVASLRESNGVPGLQPQ